MRTFFFAIAAWLLASCSAVPPASPAPSTAGPHMTSNEDPYLWLEDVQGEKAMDWVRQQNLQSQAQLMADAQFLTLRDHLIAALNARDRIPYVARRGEALYNLWQDVDHRRGLWRRTTLEEYRKPAPQWETVLDVDALARDEGENWVFAGADCLGPSYRRCLVSLSRGGADAKVIREFDTVEKRFVRDGFVLPEAKGDVAWIDENTIYVGTNFGTNTLTSSGYPRLIKRWRRGSPLTEANTVFEGAPTDVSVWVSVDRTPGFERTWFSRGLDFYRSEVQVAVADAPDGWVRVGKPDDASLSFHRQWALLELRSDLVQEGQRFLSGSLLITAAADLLAGHPHYTALFTPSRTASLSGFAWTRSRLLLTISDNVISRVEELHEDHGSWARRAVATPAPGTLSISPLDDPLITDDAMQEAYLINYADFTTPDSLMLGRTSDDAREILKQRPHQFDSSKLHVEQHFALSADGTQVPYFEIGPDAPRAGEHRPTLLYGYGGFEVSLQPWYSPGFGIGWLERGGLLIVANLRGGGEFGPSWHQAAVGPGKQKSFDDFFAVAQDLISRGVTTPRQLGIMGGSNGGLLIGAAFTQRPELFRAAVCQVPLLDMRRYHKLLAGASWMAEYGNPDKPDEWAWISAYSPYQNVKRGVHYPKVLFTTSTRDDRVHPGHARKMAARMQEQGHDVLYFENTEGGHGGAADNEQRAHLQALEYTFLWRQLSAPARTTRPRTP